MTDHVLVAVDESDPAERALEYACQHFPDARITALTVIDPSEVLGPDLFEVAAEDWNEAVQRRADELLDDVEAGAREQGVEIDRVAEVGDAADTIVGYAEEHDVDHVIVGTHGRSGPTRVLLGSVAETVVRRAPVPVTVVR